MTMFKVTNQLREKQLQLLKAHVDQQPDGATVSWLEIEQATGVEMTNAGKALYRRACRVCRREYGTIRGSGLRFSAADTAVDLIHHKIRKIGRASNRAAKTTNTLVVRHKSEMSPRDVQYSTMAMAALGAMKAIARGETVKLLKG